MKTTKRMLMVCFFLTCGVMLNACGTVKGFGQDVSKAGHGIQKAAS